VDGRYQRAELTLRQGDTVIGRGTRSSEQFTVPTRPARYRLTLDVTGIPGKSPGRDTSTATSTSWTVRSKPAKNDQPVVLPLIQIGYDIATDLNNAVRADQAYPLVLQPGYQPGADGPGQFEVDVQVSYDDGAHWRTARTRGAGTVTASVPAAPAGAGNASVRVTARDRVGNQIEQTIIRAWKIAS
jgi:hypothetical protein